MKVLAVDPGPVASAFVLWDGVRVLSHGKEPNERVRQLLLEIDEDATAVFEQVASYGMAVGAEVFETVFWTGRLYEVAPEGLRYRLPRREVKLHLCGQARANDSNIRAALIDRFGGKAAAIGRKATQGPLYGLRADEWQALALAVTFHDLQGTPNREPRPSADDICPECGVVLPCQAHGILRIERIPARRVVVVKAKPTIREMNE